MKLELFDPNISLTMNVAVSIANVLNIVYNVPQMYRTYKSKSTKDISGWFLSLRVVSNVIWVWYSIEVDSMLMLINNVVTVFASAFVGYYKIVEITKEGQNPHSTSERDCTHYPDIRVVSV